MNDHRIMRTWVFAHRVSVEERELDTGQLIDTHQADMRFAVTADTFSAACQAVSNPGAIFRSNPFVKATVEPAKPEISPEESSAIEQIPLDDGF